MSMLTVKIGSITYKLSCQDLNIKDSAKTLIRHIPCNSRCDNMKNQNTDMDLFKIALGGIEKWPSQMWLLYMAALGHG
jgi:hypothetical protein